MYTDPAMGRPYLLSSQCSVFGVYRPRHGKTILLSSQCRDILIAIACVALAKCFCCCSVGKWSAGHSRHVPAQMGKRGLHLSRSVAQTRGRLVLAGHWLSDSGPRCAVYTLYWDNSFKQYIMYQAWASCGSTSASVRLSRQYYVLLQFFKTYINNLNINWNRVHI